MEDSIHSGLFQRPMTKDTCHWQQDGDPTPSCDGYKNLALWFIPRVVDIAQSCAKPEHCYVCADLALVEQEISSTQQRLSDLIQKRGQIIKKPHQTTFIQDMPVETLAAIFVCVKESYNEGSSKPLFSQPDRSPPLLLGAVCKEWREVALRTPQIWTDIIVDLGKSPGTQLSMINEWARRSGALPLNIVVFLDGDYSKYRSTNGRSDGIPPTRKGLIKALRSHVARWHVLALRTPWTIHCALLDGLPESPPVISFYFQVLDCDQAPFRGPMVPVIHPIQPKYLYSHQKFAPLITLLQVGWDNLVHLEVREIGNEELLHIIRRAQGLRYCDTPLGSRPEGQRMQHAIFTHRSLVYLRTNHDIMGCLTLPSLEYLDYTASNTRAVQRGDPGDIESLEKFLRRSSPPLDTFILRINIFGDEEDEASESLVKLPGVTHLHVDVVHEVDGEWMDAFLTTLTQPSSELNLLRRLEEITLDVWDIHEQTWSLLPDVVKAMQTDESNQEPGTMSSVVRPLPKVRIYAKGTYNNEVKVTKDDFLLLLAIKKSGFDIAIKLSCGVDWFSEMAKVFYVEL